MDNRTFEECVRSLREWFSHREDAADDYKRRASWAVKQLGTALGLGVTERATECDDCGIKTNDLITKGDHHGGMKTVCTDRNACHARGG